VIRRRTALAFATLLAAIIVAGCGSSAATWPATGSNAPGTGAGPGTSVAPTVNPQEPSTVIDHVFTGAMGMVGGDKTIKSFHLKVGLNGTILASALKSAGSSSGLTITHDIKLDGTAIEGDVDVVKQAAHFGLTVPALELLGGAAITADLIVIDKVGYVKLSGIPGVSTKYQSMSLSNLGSLTSSLPVSVPTAGPSTLTNVEDQIAKVRQQLKDAGAEPTLVGVEKIGGNDAYHISVKVPIDLLNEKIAAASSPSPASLKIDSATFDLWAYKDTYNLAQVEIKGASSTIGSLDLVITVTNYDAPVTVTAPPASEVQTAAP
jgi:hypothetical protein